MACLFAIYVYQVTSSIYIHSGLAQDTYNLYPIKWFVYIPQIWCYSQYLFHLLPPFTTQFEIYTPRYQIFSCNGVRNAPVYINMRNSAISCVVCIVRHVPETLNYSSWENARCFWHECRLVWRVCNVVQCVCNMVQCL